MVAGDIVEIAVRSLRDPRGTEFCVLTPGEHVDRYVVEHRIGRGGMADVFAVRHRILHTRHALKVLHASDAPSVERAAREGRAQAAIDHPNVVPVRDVFEVEGHPALLMPFVNGPSLDLLLCRRALSVDETSALFRGIVEGVAHVHGRGLVHRDLKPGNVLLELRDAGLVPRVSDFGLVEARAAHRQGDREKAFFGTPGFAAPEQLRGRADLDGRVDVWGLGGVLHVMLCGALPWDEDLVEAVLQGYNARPRDVRTVVPEVPAPWAELTAWLLEPSRTDRPTSCTEVLDALAALRPHGDPLRAGGPLALDAARIASESFDSETIGLAATMLDDGSEPSLGSGAAWHTLSRPPSNMPRPIDRFVGRHGDLQALAAALEGRHAVVTVVGPAGTGKTRLALESVSRAPARTGRTSFCDLTECTDEREVLAAVARAIDSRAPGSSDRDAVVAALHAAGDTLLMLDNAERCAVALASLVDAWSTAVPRVRLIATSRVPLGVGGEFVYRLDPLEIGEGVDTTGTGVELFMERARAVDARFSVSPEQMPMLRDIVRQLDGLPLAIELAASRVRLLPLDALRDRIGQRFGVLVDTRRDGTRRSATLWGAIDASWTLLEPWERDAFAQISVFIDGFTLQAAEAVIDVSAWPEAPSPFEVLAALVDASMVQVDRRGDTARYRLLVSLRDFAAARLDEPDAIIDADGRSHTGPAARAAVEARHANWFARGGRDVVPTDGHEREPEAEVLRLVPDRANLLAAVERAAAAGAYETAASAALVAASVARAVGPFLLGDTALTRARSAEHLSPATLVRVLAEHGVLLRWMHDQRSETTLYELRDLARRLGDARAERLALRGLAFWALQGERCDEAAEFVAEARAVDGGVIDAADLSLVDFSEGCVEMMRRNEASAERLFNEALVRARRSGDRLFEGTIMYYRCNLRFNQRRYDECARDARAVVALSSRRAHRGNEAWALRLLGITARMDGRPEEARRALSRSVQIHRRINPQALDGTALHLALAALEMGDVEGARRCLNDHPPSAPSAQNAMWVSRTWAVHGLVAAHEHRPDAVAEAFAQAEGALALNEVARAEVQVLAYRARAELALGHVREASRTLDQADELAKSLSLSATYIETQEVGIARRLVSAHNERDIER